MLKLSKIPKSSPTDKIPGGLGQFTRPEDVDQEELEKGISVELEHTPNTDIAQDISLDHLSEISNYYTLLKEMEEKAKEEGTFIGEEKTEGNMYVELMKLAYSSGCKSDTSMQQKIEAVMKNLVERVGLKLDDLVSLADFFDSIGQKEAADNLDGLIKEAAKKKVVKKPPSPWFKDMVKEIKKKNPKYSEERVDKIMNDLWFNKMTPAARNKVWKSLGRKGGAQT